MIAMIANTRSSQCCTAPDTRQSAITSRPFKLLVFWPCTQQSGLKFSILTNLNIAMAQRSKQVLNKKFNMYTIYHNITLIFPVSSVLSLSKLLLFLFKITLAHPRPTLSQIISSLRFKLYCLQHVLMWGLRYKVL